MPKGVHGNHARGSRNGKWNGGRTVTEHGYVRVKVGKTHPLADPNGYAYEHHIVMCSAIGRLLAQDEVVHHVNGDRQDNRLENLELTTRRAHAIHHAAEQAAKVGAAVRLVLDGDAQTQRFEQRCLNLADQAERLARELRSAVGVAA